MNYDKIAVFKFKDTGETWSLHIRNGVTETQPFALENPDLMITLAGFIDDLPTILDNGSYKETESKFRIRQWQKPLLILPALIPLMVVYLTLLSSQLVF